MTPGPLMVDPIDAFPFYRRFVPYDGQPYPEWRPNGPDPNAPKDRGPDPWEDRDASACELISISAAHIGGRRFPEAAQFIRMAREQVLGGIYDPDKEAARRPRMHTIAAAAEYNQAIVFYRLGGNSTYLGDGQLRSARNQLDVAIRRDEEFATSELYESVDRALASVERLTERD